MVVSDDWRKWNDRVSMRVLRRSFSLISIDSLWMKKPRVDTEVSPPGGGFATLPLALAERIIDYAIASKDLVPDTWGEYGGPREYVSVASVCGAWNTVINEIIDLRALRIAAVSIPKTCRKETVWLRRKLNYRRSWIREMLLYRSPTWYFASHLGEWSALFSHMPRLQVVDLKDLMQRGGHMPPAFGRNVKKNLRELTIENWKADDWWKYFELTGEENKVARGKAGYGVTAHGALNILKACPNVWDLSICWNTYGTGTDKSDVDIRACIFDDDFCLALARECKQLRTIKFSSNAQYPVSILSSCAFSALATLPWLERVDFMSVNITSEGILALFVNHTQANSSPRNYRFKITNIARSKEKEKTFYTLIRRILEQLGESDQQVSNLDTTVSVRLINDSLGVVDYGWSSQYWATLSQLVDRARQRHPLLVVRILIVTERMEEEYAQNFETIPEFQLYSKGTKHHAWDHSQLMASNYYDDDNGDGFVIRSFDPPEEEEQDSDYYGDGDFFYPF